jgi:hypothetical protein
MNPKKTFLIEEIKQTFALFKKSLILIPIIAFLDMLFFLLVGFFREIISVKMMQKIATLTGIAQSAPSLKNLTTEKLFEAAATHMEFTQQYWELYVLLFWMICIIFILYLVINCIIWILVVLMHHKKLRILLFVKRFVLINLMWFLIILIFAFLLRKYIAMLALGPNPAINLLLLICSGVIGYFMLLSYPLIVNNSVFLSLRKTFKYGIIRFPRIALMYAYCIIALLFVDAILRMVGYLSPIAMVIGGIILVLPLFALIRVLFNETVSHIE